MTEHDYIELLHQKLGGETEISVPSGRADLLVDGIIYEVEWANNWKHSIGQSLWYSLQTNQRPGIILILRSSADYKYVIQLNSVLEENDLDNILVRVYPNDFEE